MALLNGRASPLWSQLMDLEARRESGSVPPGRSQTRNLGRDGGPSLSPTLK